MCTLTFKTEYLDCTLIVTLQTFVQIRT